MRFGYIGLGKMGKNMVLHLLEKGHNIVAWNRSPEPRKVVADAGALAVESIEELVQNLAAPRTVWLMLPAGEVTRQMIDQLLSLMEAGDTIIDGSNNHWKATAENNTLVRQSGLHFFDAGVSGGPDGARNGTCLMVGGEEEPSADLAGLFGDVALPNAYQFFLGPGAGHFVKMIHNGIEYGMMQAIGEGFEVLQKSPFNLDLPRIAQLYNTGSVIESRLMGWLESGYTNQGPELSDISGSVKHSGEGAWTVEAAKEFGVSVPIIEGSLQFRINSTNNPSYTGQVVSVLRNEFGGHDVGK